MAEDRRAELERWANQSELPEVADPKLIEQLLVEMRKELYLLPTST